MTPRLFASFLFACAATLLSPIGASAVTIAWSPIGNPGNSADGTGYGAVPYNYKMGTYDVTNSQYAEFLNTKDPGGLNKFALWNSGMSNAANGGITFNSSNPAGNKYVPIAGRQDHPVNYTNWYDAIRFANWMNNGQGDADTESGSYTIILHEGAVTPANGDGIVRSAGAKVVLPNENEWYKAAYYNPASDSYFQYPTSSDTLPIASGPTLAPNSANYGNFYRNLTDVNAYPAASSPYGAFMAGNVIDWVEDLRPFHDRGRRGAAWVSIGEALLSTFDQHTHATFLSNAFGFRIAMIPEPASIVMGLMGAAALGSVVIRKRRARS